jgi:RNA polymerase sigma factor (TIGR02999 family)
MTCDRRTTRKCKKSVSLPSRPCVDALTAVTGANSLLRRSKLAQRDPMSEHSGQISELLQQWVQGDRDALDAVAPVIYQELRQLARNHLRSERADHTLQSTALVNEAFIQLMGSQPAQLRNRAHFVAIASRLMRQILVQYARKRRASKRDGGYRIALEEIAEVPVAGDEDLVALDDALEVLSRIDERQGDIVQMRFFGGLSTPEVSQVLGISLATVERDWATARIWLRREMRRVAAP